MYLGSVKQLLRNKNTKTTICVYILLSQVLLGCTQSIREKDKTTQITSIGVDYDLTNPEKVFRLPYDLEEISGLSYFRDSIVVAIQDEEGKLFFYDYEQGKLLDDFSFGNDGDYEGVEVVEDMIYVVKSDGDLHTIDTRKKDIKSVKTKLRAKNDVEGLTYDSKNHQLILACKGTPSLNKEKQKGRSFYAYKIREEELIQEPLFKLKNKDITSFFQKQQQNIKVEEFKPSGIAIHPITNNIYVLAHGGKWLLILNNSYQIIGISSLKSKIFKQPEGICFTPKGDMMISNEGQGDRGTLLYYKYTRQRKASFL